MNKKAFTLAEVLITLGIIGIVAALTIPGLITTYKKHLLETQMKEFYSLMNQAIKLSEVYNDDMSGWNWPPKESHAASENKNSDWEWYQTYLQPYLKASPLKTSYHLYCVWNGGFAIEFINGSGASCGTAETVLQHKFICLYYPNAGTIKDIEDNSQKAQKVVPGKDYFVFYFEPDPNKKGFYPIDKDCYQTKGMQYLPSPGCAKLIKDNNWKIPADYPVKL